MKDHPSVNATWGIFLNSEKTLMLERDFSIKTILSAILVYDSYQQGMGSNHYFRNFLTSFVHSWDDGIVYH